MNQIEKTFRVVKQTYIALAVLMVLWPVAAGTVATPGSQPTESDLLSRVLDHDREFALALNQFSDRMERENEERVRTFLTRL